MVDSREKGARAERAWAEHCQLRYGLTDSHRTAQRRGAHDSNDVVTWPGTHCECKHVERLNVEEAMQQAERDCGGKSIPYVAHKRNRTAWMVTVRADQLVEFCKLVLSQQGWLPDPELRR